MIVDLEELQHGGRHLRRRGPHQGGRDHPDEERRGGHVPVVAFVAHLERLRGQVLEIDRPAHIEGPGDGRRERPVQPAQPVEDVRAIGAEAQDLAHALVQYGEGAIAARRVLHDEDGHRGRDHARHGSHRPEVMAGREGDGPAVGQPLRRFG